MSHFSTDLTYTKLVGLQLPNFTPRGGDVYAFSHTCETSDRGRIQTRANLFHHNGAMLFHCYHCGASSSLGNFLKEVSPSLYSEYRMEKFKGRQFQPNTPIFTSTIDQEEDEPEPINHGLPDCLISLASLEKTHPVVIFAKKRCIPIHLWKDVFFAPDFNHFASLFDQKFAKKSKKYPRLVLPAFNEEKKPIWFTGRAFGAETPKYINVMIDARYPKIYGLDRVDFAKTVYVTEGQIDSMFVDNCIAVGQASYNHEILQKNRDKLVLIPDSDWRRNPIVYKQLLESVKSGFSVSILPKTLPGKDINDIIKAGFDRDRLQKMIPANTLSGPAAILKLTTEKMF